MYYLLKKKISITFISVLLIFAHGHLFAQTSLNTQPPTLQIGLDGLSFNKGSLDAQLIMEIVAEKQQEIKIKTLQTVFLTKVKYAGGTMYSFTDNVVRELLTEKDPNIRTKKILENTINVVFVGAFLNFYLNQATENKKTHLIELSKLYSCMPADTSKSLNISAFTQIQRNSTNQIYRDTSARNFISLLVDMCSEVVKNDAKLQQLGLMQISYSETYDYLNTFKTLLIDGSRKIIIEEPTPLQKKNLSALQLDLLTIKRINEEKKEKADLAKIVYDEMKSSLSDITDYIGLVNFFVTEYSYRNEKLEFYKGPTYNKDNQLTIDQKKEALAKIKSKINSMSKSLSGPTIKDSATIAEIKNLNQIYLYLDKSTRVFENDKVNQKNIADIIYTFNTEFQPILINQSYRDTGYISIIDDLNKITRSFGETLLNNNNTLKVITDKIDPFILLSSKLYQFNKSSTISEYLKLIEDIGSIFPDDNITNALNTVITFIKDYTVIEENQNGKEVINFNVESFLVKLQGIKPYKLSHLEFNFTVGVNNAFFNSDLILSDGSINRNLSYVGEKIGVKYKIKDWAFYMNRNPGETYSINKTPYIKTAPPIEPLISNAHILLYGSGLLYNLVNTKTNKEFNMPLLGLGLGVTFYNALDFNVSYGIPIFPDRGISNSFDNSFLNIGFDIQFIEYYNRLRAKQSANKTQKQLAEAKI